MQSLKERMQEANSLLAPYAVPHGDGLGRVYPEKPDETRFPFQRDRDRIIHTQAFRRLKHKTQVFVSGHGDHYRTRITHTLEVAQISRDMARTLGLNEDLAEAIALAHDLGHTPFGHAGEEAMDACMQKFGKRFEHNEQSLRIVTVLEERAKRYPGLNLSIEILEGLMKHRTPHDHPSLTLRHTPLCHAEEAEAKRRPSRSATSGACPEPSRWVPQGDNQLSMQSLSLEAHGSTELAMTECFRGLSLEAQIVNLADEIAYTAHDTDDGIRSGLFQAKHMRKTRLLDRASRLAKKSGTEIRGVLVHLLVTDMYAHLSALLKAQKIISLRAVYSANDLCVGFSPSLQPLLKEHRKFLWDNLYMSASVQRQMKRGQRVITSLFARYLKHPPAKVVQLMKKTHATLDEAVKDYIAGMTDGYALQAEQV